jgi:ATP-dependent exoDNAse (exonuclease V) beta subunit
MPDGPEAAALVVADVAARERALEPGRSCLVQAPAGSGKTELLIQRFLALLARVERPEEIVAMTFTRKAAGEMRERIVAALDAALAGTATDSPHAQRTRELALAALDADRRHGWHLVAHPARLAVVTIDAFAAGLARQAPLATGMGGTPRFEELAAPRYLAAARAALEAAPAANAAWRRLLAHADNDAAGAITLIADLLSKREQWIGELRPLDRAGFRGAPGSCARRRNRGRARLAGGVVPASLAGRARPLRAPCRREPRGRPETAQWASHLAACAAAGGIPHPPCPGRSTGAPWPTGCWSSMPLVSGCR